MTVPATPRQLLSAELGIVVPADDAPALLGEDDARYRRLAWTGARLLGVLSVRRAASLGTVPQDLPAALEAHLSDDALRASAGRRDVGRLLAEGTDPADLVRAAVASGHRTQGWSGALAVAVRLVDPGLGQTPLPKALDPAVAVEAGRVCTAAAAGLWLAARSPEDDAAALEAAAAALPSPADAALADVGRVLVVKGPQPAVQAALPLLR